jgi:hypothetical protein
MTSRRRAVALGSFRPLTNDLDGLATDRGRVAPCRCDRLRSSNSFGAIRRSTQMMRPPEGAFCRGAFCAIVRTCTEKIHKKENAKYARYGLIWVWVLLKVGFA